jgi:uncharacterized protein with FMN-binding domain
MVLGFIAAALFLLTAAKFLTKRLRPGKLDARYLKLHKVSGILLVAVSAVHLAAVMKLLHQRPIWMYVLGFGMLISALAAALSFALRKNGGSKWLKVHRAASAALCIFLAAHIVLGVTSYLAYQKAVASITYSDIDIGRVADGEYTGEYDAGYIYAKVSVAVKDGEIVSAELLEHRNERGGPAGAITGAVVSAQSLGVDAVSGATNSSKVIKKAIENALAQGIG